MNDLFGGTRVPLDERHPDHAALQSLERDLLQAVGGQELFEERLRGFFRAAIDEVIDTGRTGRYFLSDLEKTEKTYLGTKFENLIRDWLQVPRGVRLDLLVGGREVDVKTTTQGHGWMMPPEIVDEYCILLRVNELDARCWVGLFLARDSYLGDGRNRDAKRTVKATARSNIWWMARDLAYTPNFWMRVSLADRDAIMGLPSGTKRMAALFRKYQGVGISRVQIMAVAAEEDFMRRVRRGGGARDALAKEGIAILYSEFDRALMRSLNLSFGSREFMSYTPRNTSERERLRTAGHID